MARIDSAVAWTFRLLPAAVLFSALFAAEGSLRWIGLLGIVPLVLAFQRDCPSCALRRIGTAPTGYTPWPGH